ARLSFVGADAAIEILADADAASGETIAPMRSVRVRRGQIVRVGSIKNGATLYIAVEGGFDIEPVLGSVSTDSRGKMGGWHGRALLEGDALPLARATASEHEEARIDGLDLAAPPRFRAVLGPQSDYFSADEIERFFAGEYTVSAGSNRMGMRLQGPPIRHRRGFNIVSDAIATGSVQVPGSGQPIVLLADHQTTGGYPKIATVISADLPAISRLPIGAKFSFALASLEEAAAARRKLATTLDEIGEKIVRLSPPAAAVAARLLEVNLISGVYDAAA
ncbi:MAG: biotin-dependent carboxyltransferase family protein, partial [Xanthobacteraceae bacterium]